MISWAKILKDHCPVSVEKYKTRDGKTIYTASLGNPSVRFCGEKWENLQKRIDAYLKTQDKDLRQETQQEEVMLVFVYGTLKHDYHNNHFLDNSPYIGQYILPDFKLVTKYNLPAVVPSKGDSVRGEVYSVRAETLKKLDCLESNGVFYNRLLTHVRLDVDNDHLESREIYVYCGHPKHWGDAKDGFKNCDGVYQWN